MGAAIGAAIGGLFGRSPASTGGAMGALAGAVIAEKRHDSKGVIETISQTKEKAVPRQAD